MFFMHAFFKINQRFTTVLLNLKIFIYDNGKKFFQVFDKRKNSKRNFWKLGKKVKPVRNKTSLKCFICTTSSKQIESKFFCSAACCLALGCQTNRVNIYFDKNHSLKPKIKQTKKSQNFSNSIIYITFFVRELNISSFF